MKRETSCFIRSFSLIQPKLYQTLISVSIIHNADEDRAKIETTLRDSSITINTINGKDVDTNPAKTEELDPVGFLGGDWRADLPKF